MATQIYGQIIGWIFFLYATLMILWDIQAWHSTSHLYGRIPWKQSKTMLKLVLRSRIHYYLWLPAVPVLFLLFFTYYGASYPWIFTISILPFWAHLVFYQGLPPSVVLLGTSRHELFDLRHWLERALNPYRVVVLLEPVSTIDKQDNVFRKNQFNWDNLRTSDGKWRFTAFSLIELSPTLVIDARIHTMGVAEEIFRISKSNLIQKALIISNEDGTVPAIDAAEIKFNPGELNIVKVTEVVTGLKKMVLTRTASPDDAFITANASSKYQSRRLEKQMRVISKSGIPVLKAIRAAEHEHGRSPFMDEVHFLTRKLNGNPGDGALEVLANLKSDIEMLNDFIVKWQNTTISEYLEVVHSIKSVKEALDKLQLIVDQAPPVFLERNEQRLLKITGKS